METSVLKYFQEEVHQVSVSKGWHERERSYVEMAGLIISEIGELIEAVRDPQQSEKIPEYSNVAEEASDILIRILDTCEQCGIDLSCYMSTMSDIEVGEDKLQAFQDFMNMASERTTENSVDDANPIEIAALITTSICFSISEGMKSVVSQHHLPFVAYLAESLFLLFCFCEVFGIKLGDAVVAKHQYNAGRPYRHGGKLY